MSTKSSLWWTETAHLYVDYADEVGGAHAYLEMHGGLVKYLYARQTHAGLAVTLRLPAEVLPILRKDISLQITEWARPRTKAERDRAAEVIEQWLTGVPKGKRSRSPRGNRARPRTRGG
jgi:hypothetical protein